MIDNYDIIICSGGKCASRTLVKTFTKNDFITFHTHGRYVNVDQNINSIPELINIQKKNKIYIFDSYRTPIERHISAFFQNLILYIFKPFDKINIDMLIYWYNKYYIDCDNYHPLDDIIPIFNGCIMDYDKEYIKKVIKKEDKEIIYVKLRFKSISLWNKILSEILNKEIIIYPENISYFKDYYSLLKEFNKKYLVPIEYLNKIQTYDTFKRYNSLFEKEEYIKEWNNKSMYKDLFLEKINDDMFNNIPEDFDIYQYKKINLLEYYNDIDAKIHYEFKGFYQNLKYKD